MEAKKDSTQYLPAHRMNSMKMKLRQKIAFDGSRTGLNLTPF